MKLDICLSVEELALVLSLQGKAQAGYDLLTFQLGNRLDIHQAQERLVAASHTLIARGLAAVDVTGTIHLMDSVALVGNLMTEPDFSVRFMRADLNSQHTFTFHVRGSDIFQHEVEQGVAHSFSHIDDFASILQSCREFFDLSRETLHPADAHIYPIQLIEYVNVRAWDKVERCLTENSESSPNPQTRLIEDMRHPVYRGNVMNITYGSDNSAVSEDGFLLLGGKEWVWILTPKRGPDADTVSVQICTPVVLTSQLQRLFRNPQ